jgi:predicted SAM-dependent methyltransferase
MFGGGQGGAAPGEWDRRLRRLQRAYYEAPGKDESVIREYLRTLAEARAACARAAGRPLARPRLHLGSGGHRLEGWINLDIEPAGADVAADCSRALPFADASAAFIHCEDLIEHLDREGGARLLAECFRVLRPGGTLRLLTPDLERLVRRVYLGAQARHLAWCSAQLAAEGPCQALNMHLRMNGEHRFLYDGAELSAALVSAGFRVERVRWNRSKRPELRYLDLRDFGLNLFVEATRP